MRQINPNLLHLNNSLKTHRGSVLSGSSRSGKTYSSIHFIILLCSRTKTPLTINIVKETYNSFKTTLYDDFNRILPQFGLYNPFQDKKEVDTFEILGCKINFLGADKPSKFHGASCDYLYINESLDISQEIFDQAEMRCRVFWWMDYNPKLTQHWIFDKVVTRPDVSFLKTTFRHNPFISKAEKNKILSYEPTKENIANGTADDYMWSVYGLGEKTPPEGLIFKNITYIDQWPNDIAPVYGLDFGFTTDPTALVKAGEQGNNIYFELLLYQPTYTPELINDYCTAQNIPINLPCFADCADKYTAQNKGTIEMVNDLYNLGWDNIQKIHKTNSVMYWLSKLKDKKIHIVNNHLVNYAKKEQENYRLKTVNGIAVNQPIDAYNHFWDAARYAFMAMSQGSNGFL